MQVWYQHCFFFVPTVWCNQMQCLDRSCLGSTPEEHHLNSSWLQRNLLHIFTGQSDGFVFVIQITQTGTRIYRGRRFEVSKGERGPIDTNAANDVVLSLNKFDDEFTESDRHDVNVLEELELV